MGRRMTAGALVVALLSLLCVSGVAWAATVVFASLQTEDGTRTTNATVVNDTTAANGQAVRFTEASGGFQANCITTPSTCGYPDATNTGVPSGTILTNSGSITVTTDGAVVENRNVSGQIIVRAKNVTIRNTRITSGDYYPISYDARDNVSGLVVEDTEIIGTNDAVTACISFGEYTARRVHCRGGADGFKADGNVLIEDSYVHDLRESEGSHNDGVQTTGGSNVTIRHTTIDLRGDTAEVFQLGTEWGSNSNWTIEDNLLAGGGWVFNSGSDPVSGMIVRNNRFAGTRGYGIAQPGSSTFTNNYYDATGAPICTGGGC